MKILVTGGAGFVAGYLAAELYDAGHEVIMTDIRAPSCATSGDYRFYTADLTDKEQFKKLVREVKPDAVAHLGAISFVPDAANDPDLVTKVNVCGTENLVQAVLSEVPRARFLFVSTAYVLKDPPLSAYAATKLAAEAIVSASGLDAIIARPANHTGPGQSDKFVVPSFIKQALEIKAGKRDQFITGNLESTRDFTDVRDVVSAYRLLIEKGVAGKTYNICADTMMSIGEVLNLIKRITDVSAPFVIDPAIYRPTDASILLDTSKLRALGWKQRIAIEKTLNDMIYPMDSRIHKTRRSLRTEMLNYVKTQFSFYINRIQLFGIKGVLTYPRTLVRRIKKHSKFIENAKNFPIDNPQRGITIIGDFYWDISLSKVLRDFVFSLKDAGIPYQTCDITRPENKKIHEQDIAAALTDPQDFKILKYDHVISMFDSVLPQGELGLHCARIGFWEFDSGFDYAYPDMCRGLPRIGMSDFNVNLFRRCTTDGSPVYKILYPFRPSITELLPHDQIRHKYGIAPNDFIVFYNFDFGSTFYRKNPDGAMRAFAWAFKETLEAKLLFKTRRATRYVEDVQKLEKLASELGISDRVIMVNDFLSDNEMYSLANICDVYLSLHRGEGFGITVAEAMSLGKPVIVTNYSATTEFCNTNNSVPVPFKLVCPTREQIGSDAYAHVTAWAEPDWIFAGKALKNLYDSPNKRSNIGIAGRKVITDYFSINNFQKSVHAFLDNE